MLSTPRLPFAIATTVVSGVVLLGTSGCLQPGSPGWDNAPHTWSSTASFPAQLALVDTRSHETVWSATVPVGGRVVTQFRQNRGETNSRNPDLLVYTLHDGDGRVSYGHLRKSLPVPPAESRKWVLSPQDDGATPGVTMRGHLTPFVADSPIQRLPESTGSGASGENRAVVETAPRLPMDAADKPTFPRTTPMDSSGTTPGVIELMDGPDENTERMLRDMILEPAAGDDPAVLQGDG